VTSLLNLLVTLAPRSVSFVEMVCLKLNVPSGLKLTNATTPDKTLLLIDSMTVERSLVKHTIRCQELLHVKCVLKCRTTAIASKQHGPACSGVQQISPMHYSPALVCLSMQLNQLNGVYRSRRIAGKPGSHSRSCKVIAASVIYPRSNKLVRDLAVDPISLRMRENRTCCTSSFASVVASVL